MFSILVIRSVKLEFWFTGNLKVSSLRICIIAVSSYFTVTLYSHFKRPQPSTHKTSIPRYIPRNIQSLSPKNNPNEKNLQLSTPSLYKRSSAPSAIPVLRKPQTPRNLSD
eukprot:TCONS_00068949-protein